MTLKQKIEQSFDAASQSYEKVAYIQKQCAFHLVKILNIHYKNFTPRSIFDVGTGTGYIPEILLKFFPNAYYQLNDISDNMLTSARSKFIDNPRISFYKGDIETGRFNFHDLIISNLSLQWVENLQLVIKNLYRKSNFLAFSCLVFGTFHDWNKRLESYGLEGIIKSYPSEGELQKFLQTLNPYKQYTKVKNFFLKFKNPISLMRYLKALGANTPVSNADFNKLLRLIKMDRNPCNLEYKVMFVLLEKDYS